MSSFKIGTVLSFGAAIMLLADILLLYVPFNFLYIILFTAILKSVGTSMYMVISNSLEWSIIGESDYPSKTASYFEMLKILVSLSVVGVTAFLTLNEYFLTAFLFSGLFIFFSLYPLLKIDLPSFKVFSFKEVFRQLPVSSILANINIDHQFVVTAIPLIILLQFGNLEKSILVVSIVLIVNGLISYFAGIAKSKNHKWLLYIATVGSFLVWIIYGFTHSVSAFIILGILLSAADIIISNGRESKLGQDLSKTNDHIATAYVVEFFRSLGESLGIIILIILFYTIGTMPQWFLILVPIFTIPKIYYALQPVRNNL